MQKFVCGNIKFKIAQFDQKTIFLPKKWIDEKTYNKKMSDMTLKKFYEESISKLENDIYNLKNASEVEETKESFEQINTLTNDVGKSLENRKRNIENILDKLANRVVIKNAFYDNYIPTKKSHGFSGVIVDDEIFFTFHSSGENANILGIDVKNIFVNEDKNPIKYVNIIQKMKIAVFKNFFTVTEPQKMLEAKRYGINKKEDMAYCSCRVLSKSIKESDKLIEIKEDNSSEISLSIKSVYIGDESKDVYLPAQVEIMSKDIGESIINDIVINIDNMKDDYIKKSELLDIINKNYSELI